MANIYIEKRRFSVEFEALGPDGKMAHIRSFYSPAGKPITLRQPDKRTVAERFRFRHPDRPRSRVRQGIYEFRSVGGYLAFIDKLKSEEQIFLNWRRSNARSYRRVPVGRTGFHTYAEKPHPKISDLVFIGGRFFIAWISAHHPAPDLILTSIDPLTAHRCDLVIASKLGLVTLVSLAHIGSHGLIVCHRAAIGNEDSRIDVFPVRLAGRKQKS